MPDDRYERGAKIVADVYKGVGAEFLAELARMVPDLPRYVREFAFGDIYSRPGLVPAERELVILACLATLGDSEHEIRAHTHGALNVGLSREQIVEAVLQTTPYAGFPRAIAAMRAVAQAFKERDADGEGN
jgi:4-carboxymuconolactone decarboxylase